MHLCTGDMFLLLPTYRQVATKMKDKKNQHFPSHAGAHGIVVDLVIVFIGATSGVVLLAAASVVVMSACSRHWSSPIGCWHPPSVMGRSCRLS
jgi:hypothetical protein